MDTIGNYVSKIEKKRPVDAFSEEDDIAMKPAPTRQTAIKVPGVQTAPASSAVSDLVTKFKSTLEAARLKIVEQADLIEQITGGPKLYGIVIQVFPVKFAKEDFYTPKAQPDGSSKDVGVEVRILRGPYAGRLGRVISTISADGKAFIAFPQDRTKINATLVRMTENPKLRVFPNSLREREVINPDPSDYQVGTQVWHEESWREVVSNVSPKGLIQILVGDDLVPINVGKDELVAPAGKKAGSVYVLVEGRILEAKMPREGSVAKGDVVSLNPMTFEIVSIGGLPSFGETVFFEALSDDGLLEVKVGSQQASKLVYTVVDPTDFKQGDRLSLDATNGVVMKLLPRELKASGFSADTGVDWSMIGGQDEAILKLQQAIEWPVKHAAKFARFGKKPSKGALLYGPPGTGKTLIAKATATAITKVYNGVGADSAFIYVKGPEFLSQYVGMAEQAIRQIFASARAHKAEHGYPAVIYIDEPDAILGKRGSSRSSDVDKTIVPMFLAEMDGLDDSCAFILLSCNLPDKLDPAITRDGRIDHKIKIARPDRKTAASIFKIHLRDIPLDGLTIDEAVDAAVNALFFEGHVLYKIEYTSGVAEAITLGDLASGAMIAGIAQRATTNAMVRSIMDDIDSYVSVEDIIAAAEETFREQHDLNHDDDITHHVGGRTVSRILKISEASTLLTSEYEDLLDAPEL